MVAPPTESKVSDTAALVEAAMLVSIHDNTGRVILQGELHHLEDVGENPMFFHQDLNSTTIKQVRKKQVFKPT